MAGPGRPRKVKQETQEELQAKINALTADIKGMESELQKERQRSEGLINMMAKERANILQLSDSLFDDMQQALDSVERTTGVVMRSDVEYHALLVRRMMRYALSEM
jgi:hypothetical protein